MHERVAKRRAWLHLVRGESRHLHIARIVKDQSLLAIKHQQAVGHVVEGRRQQHVLFPQAPIGESAGEAHAEHGNGDAGDRKRQHGRRQREGIDETGGVRHDFDRAHRGEVVRDDCKREQHCGDQRGTYFVATNCGRERAHAEYDAEDNGSGYERRIPGDISRHLQRPHAGVVHSGDATADDATAERGSPTRAARQRYPKPDPGHRCGRSQGKCEQADAIGDRNAWLVRKHGNEVRRPDPASGRGSGGRKPAQPSPAAGGARAMKQIDCGETGEKTDQNRKQNKPPIMLDREAGEHLEHGILPVRVLAFFYLWASVGKNF